MALSPENLLKPQGVIEGRSMFPGESTQDVQDRLQSYIDEGTTKAADVDPAKRDGAVREWCYYRAFDAVFIELISNPSSQAMADEGSTLYTSAQMEFLKTERDRHLALFQGYLDSQGYTSNREAFRSASVDHRQGF